MERAERQTAGQKSLNCDLVFQQICRGRFAKNLWNRESKWSPKTDVTQNHFLKLKISGFFLIQAVDLILVPSSSFLSARRFKQQLS